MQEKITHVKFKQAAHLGGKDYAKNSIHEITEELGQNHYFKKLVVAGLVVPHSPVKVMTPEEMHKHHSAMAEQLLASVDKNVAAKKAASAQAEGEDDKDAKASESASQAESESDEQAEGEEHQAEEKEEHAAPKKSKHRK